MTAMAALPGIIGRFGAGWLLGWQLTPAAVLLASGVGGALAIAVALVAGLPLLPTGDAALKYKQEQIERYMAQERESLVVMRVELGMAHEEIAEVTGSPSPNAARMRVARALADLARQMSDFRPD